MQLTDDSALLRQFVENQSEEAFGALVTRHINLVYSVALRQLGEPHQAEEITQAVFIILAKKAAGIRHEQALTSWLFQTTRLTAKGFIRSEMRRRRLQQEAYMQTVLEEPADDAWPEIAPLLEKAVGSLREKDRQAILLRFYEGRNMREIGPILGVSEDAAEKRVSRALEKLRRFFARRGVHSTTAVIGQMISANSVQTAPLALAKAVTAMAVAKGASTSVSTLTVVKGVLKIMTWTKTKITIVTAAAVLLSVGTGIGIQKAVQWRTDVRGKLILRRVIAANRLWLVAPADNVTDYSYVFHLQWGQAPGGSILTPVHVEDPHNAPANQRQGITYVSVLQHLAKYPDQVEVKKIAEADGKITLALKILPAPGAPRTSAMGGRTYPVPPLQIDCGNGISQSWRGQFQTGGTNAVLVIDAQKMVPLHSTIPGAKVDESFSDYTEISPGNYVPLSMALKYSGLPPKFGGDMAFDWTFKLHNGLWLFDEAQYRGEKVAWTDQVVVN